MLDMKTCFQSMKIQGLTPKVSVQLLREGIRLAKGYYILGCFESSESIISDVIAKLTTLDSARFRRRLSREQAHAYALYGCLCHRRER